jgi:hypothetical protein
MPDECAPELAADRALRARQLETMATRRRVARSLRRVVSEAEHPAAALLTAAVPVCRREVWRWHQGLLGLAERLERPGPVNPCGVARVLELITDGSGPFYNAAAPLPLGEAIWWVADGLQSGAPDDDPI